MTKEWVDFKAIKAAVTMLMILDYYQIKGLVKTQDELRGPCPIHKGSQQTKSFTVNVRTRSSASLMFAKRKVTFWISSPLWRDVRCEKGLRNYRTGSR